jgi:hypothetical protein
VRADLQHFSTEPRDDGREVPAIGDQLRKLAGPLNPVNIDRPLARAGADKRVRLEAFLAGIGEQNMDVWPEAFVEDPAQHVPARAPT